jgi:hypothetical protein
VLSSTTKVGVTNDMSRTYGADDRDAALDIAISAALRTQDPRHSGAVAQDVA